MNRLMSGPFDRRPVERPFVPSVFFVANRFRSSSVPPLLRVKPVPSAPSVYS